jgi:hypothetical protein
LEETNAVLKEKIVDPTDPLVNPDAFARRFLNHYIRNDGRYPEWWDELGQIEKSCILSKLNISLDDFVHKRFEVKVSDGKITFNSTNTNGPVFGAKSAERWIPSSNGGFVRNGRDPMNWRNPIGESFVPLGRTFAAQVMLPVVVEKTTESHDEAIGLEEVKEVNETVPEWDVANELPERIKYANFDGVVFPLDPLVSQTGEHGFLRSVVEKVPFKFLRYKLEFLAVCIAASIIYIYVFHYGSGRVVDATEETEKSKKKLASVAIVEIPPSEVVKAVVTVVEKPAVVEPEVQIPSVPALACSLTQQMVGPEEKSELKHNSHDDYIVIGSGTKASRQAVAEEKLLLNADNMGVNVQDHFAEERKYYEGKRSKKFERDAADLKMDRKGKNPQKGTFIVYNQDDITKMLGEKNNPGVTMQRWFHEKWEYTQVYTHPKVLELQKEGWIMCVWRLPQHLVEYRISGDKEVTSSVVFRSAVNKLRAFDLALELPSKHKYFAMYNIVLSMKELERLASTTSNDSRIEGVKKALIDQSKEYWRNSKEYAAVHFYPKEYRQWASNTSPLHMGEEKDSFAPLIVPENFGPKPERNEAVSVCPDLLSKKCCERSRIIRNDKAGILFHEKRCGFDHPDHEFTAGGVYIPKILKKHPSLPAQEQKANKDANRESVKRKVGVILKDDPRLAAEILKYSNLILEHVDEGESNVSTISSDWCPFDQYGCKIKDCIKKHKVTGVEVAEVNISGDYPDLIRTGSNFRVGHRIGQKNGKFEVAILGQCWMGPYRLETVKHVFYDEISNQLRYPMSEWVVLIEGTGYSIATLHEYKIADGQCGDLLSLVLKDQEMMIKLQEGTVGSGKNKCLAPVEGMKVKLVWVSGSGVKEEKGVITKILPDGTFVHNCDTDSGHSGAAIFSFSGYVVGRHKSRIGELKINKGVAHSVALIQQFGSAAKTVSKNA